jgi:hypothetical protein
MLLWRFTAVGFMIMLMQEQHNPYQFIQDTDHTKKRSLASIGNSKQSRILIVLGGVFALIIVAVIVMSLISSAANAGKAELLKVAQKQTEIIRVSKLGMERAKGSSAKNLATTVNLSLQSDQSTLVTTLKSAGVKVSAKDLALGKNPKTDVALTNAEQSNKFDEVFTETIQAQLVDYQRSLKSAFDKTDSKKLQQTLSAQFTTAGLLATAKQ